MKTSLSLGLYLLSSVQYPITNSRSKPTLEDLNFTKRKFQLLIGILLYTGKYLLNFSVMFENLIREDIPAIQIVHFLPTFFVTYFSTFLAVSYM